MIPTLAVRPEFAVDITDEYAVAVSDSLSPLVQRAEDSPRDRRAWRFVWRNGSRADKDAVVSLIDQCAGGAGRFLYQPPDELAPIEMRLIEDSLTWRKETARRYTLAFSAREF
jgi:hypothetical protein